MVSLLSKRSRSRQCLSRIDILLLLLFFKLPEEFVQAVDRRMDFKEVPMVLSKLERNSTAQKFHVGKCTRYLKVSKPYLKFVSSLIY